MPTPARPCRATGFRSGAAHSHRRSEARSGGRWDPVLEGRKPTGARPVERRDGRYFPRARPPDEAPEPIETEENLGVECERRRVAVDNDGIAHEASATEQIPRASGRLALPVYGV